MPHIVHLIEFKPGDADETFFHFVAWVEVCRQRKEARIPDDLVLAYRRSLSLIPGLVAKASGKRWTNEFARSALAAIAASQGAWQLAEVILELNNETVHAVQEWLQSR